MEREGRGSVCAESQCRPYEDATDLFTAVGLSEKESKQPEPYKPLLTILPVIGSNPTQGVLAGVAVIVGIYLGDPETTTISNISANILYTTKNQFLSGINSVLMLNNNSWQLQGDWRFLIFNQDTFGLGTKGPGETSGGFTLNGYGTTSLVKGAQPMDLNLIRIRENFLKRVTETFYIGPGFDFDRYYAIDDSLLDLGATPPVVTSHYAYSTALGFDPGAYNTSAAEPEPGLGQPRFDHQPLPGHLRRARLPVVPALARGAPGQLAALRRVPGVPGALQDGAEERARLLGGVPEQRDRDAALPRRSRPSAGTREPDRPRLVQGRFRGTAEIYAEAEWRFRITDNGLLGGVVFANAETFSAAPVSILGFAARESTLRVHRAGRRRGRAALHENRQSRTNITLDVTVAEKTWGSRGGRGVLTYPPPGRGSQNAPSAAMGRGRVVERPLGALLLSAEAAAQPAESAAPVPEVTAPLPEAVAPVPARQSPRRLAPRVLARVAHGDFWSKEGSHYTFHSLSIGYLMSVNAAGPFLHLSRVIPLQARQDGGVHSVSFRVPERRRRGFSCSDGNGARRSPRRSSSRAAPGCT